MQQNFIKAFRERLRRADYSDVSIYDCGNGNEFIVYVTKDNKKYRYRMTKTQIECCPMPVWFYWVESGEST